MHKTKHTLKAKAFSTICKAKNILKSEKGDFYISDGVKIIIAVVLGALLLAACLLYTSDAADD